MLFSPCYKAEVIQQNIRVEIVSSDSEAVSVGETDLHSDLQLVPLTSPPDSEARAASTNSLAASSVITFYCLSL